MHQYVLRGSGTVLNERLIADRVIRFLYNRPREEPGALLSALASAWVTDQLAHWEFDRRLRDPVRTLRETIARLGIDESEMLDQVESMRTLRELFERRIRYWRVRPLPSDEAAIVSSADGKALPFATEGEASLPVKARFLSVPAILGPANPWARWPDLALSGVIVRLTPEVYHYTHAPVAGRIQRYQLIEGAFHSCNPHALTTFTRSYEVNRRAVTVYDTDVPGGSGVGLVVQVDVAAMMIGQIVPAYSEIGYTNPRPLVEGEFVARGVPVSMFRPGSSTSIVIWQSARAAHAPELLRNARRADLRSRFSDWLGSPWVETALRVREAIAYPLSATTDRSGAMA
ncbi:MAG: phosphatidylserine decarboxylase [Casimicrobiaceae bacterium]|nr:phosphatidylserine decarboxylase [Casimicrobiaceae bacterium]